MQKILGSIRKVRFTLSTLRQASIRENNGSSLGKMQVKVPHQRSPYAMKFEDKSHEQTERQQRSARSKAWNLAKNIFKLKENDKATFHSPAEKWVLPAASTNEPEEREFVADSRASMHMVSKRDPNFAELETMRTSRSPTTVMTANGEVQTREKSDSLCQAIGLIRHGYVSWRNSLHFFLSGSSVMIMGIHTTGPAVKNHISSKRARELIAIYQTMCHSWSLIYLGVPVQRPHLLHHHLHHKIRV